MLTSDCQNSLEEFSVVPCQWDFNLTSSRAHLGLGGSVSWQASSTSLGAVRPRPLRPWQVTSLGLDFLTCQWT